MINNDKLMLHVTLPYDITGTYLKGFTKILSEYPAFRHFHNIKKAIEGFKKCGVDMSHINIPNTIVNNINVTDKVFEKCVTQNKNGLLVYEPSAGYNPCSSSLKIPGYRLINRIAKNMNYVSSTTNNANYILDLPLDDEFNHIFPKEHDIYKIVLNYMTYESVGKDLTLCLTDYRVPHPDIVFRDLLKAIQELSKASLVHTSISGANVVYDQEKKKVSLIDFGMCKAYDEFIVSPDDFETFEKYNNFSLNFNFSRGCCPIEMLYARNVLMTRGADKDVWIKYSLECHLTNATNWLWSFDEIESILNSDLYAYKDFDDLLIRMNDMMRESAKKYDIYSVGLLVANLWAVIGVKPNGYMYSILKACTHPDYKLRISPMDLVITSEHDIKCTVPITEYKDEEVPDMSLHTRQEECGCCVDVGGVKTKHTFRDQAVCAIGLCGKINADALELF